MRKEKLVGSTFMVIGTAIGAGILALPLVCSAAGFTFSALILLFTFLIMLISGFLMTEVNFAFPEYKNNFSTMAEATLGRPGKMISWVITLLLIYAVLAAYILGNASLLSSLLLLIHVTIPTWITAILFIIVLGGAVYWSTRAVDILNRGLLSIKGVFLLAALAFLFPYIDITTLSRTMNSHTASYSLAIIPIFMTAFGFHSIIPTLRNYIGSKSPKELKMVMLCGISIVAIIYILWILVILGSVPLAGEHSFTSLAKEKGSVGEFIKLINIVIKNKLVIASMNGFANIAMTTSFLGTALGLFDFLAEGFKRPNTRKGRFQTWLLTFIPPLVFALFYPKGFILALGYASIFIAILWVIMPALMAYRLRKHATLSSPYRVFGGNALLIAIIIVGIGITVLQILNNLKLLPVL